MEGLLKGNSTDVRALPVVFNCKGEALPVELHCSRESRGWAPDVKCGDPMVMVLWVEDFGRDLDEYGDSRFVWVDVGRSWCGLDGLPVGVKLGGHEIGVQNSGHGGRLRGDKLGISNGKGGVMEQGTVDVSLYRGAIGKGVVSKSCPVPG